LQWSRTHGIIKNRGMSRLLVHGREKVRAVCLLQALALNLCWANTLRRRIAAAASNGDAGERMTATGDMSSAIPHDIRCHSTIFWKMLPNFLHLKVEQAARRHSPKKAGLGYTLIDRVAQHVMDCRMDGQTREDLVCSRVLPRAFSCLHHTRTSPVV
jgi:hypothetical protein